MKVCACVFIYTHIYEPRFSSEKVNKNKVLLVGWF